MNEIALLSYSKPCGGFLIQHRTQSSFNVVSGLQWVTSPSTPTTILLPPSDITTLVFFLYLKQRLTPLLHLPLHYIHITCSITFISVICSNITSAMPSMFIPVKTIISHHLSSISCPFFIFFGLLSNV